MVSSRTATALAGVAVSLVVSAVLWWQFGVALFFLFVPVVPFLFRRRRDEPQARTCPECGFRTRDASYEFCPRDGTRLE